MISALESLDVSAAEWLAERDPALTHLPDGDGGRGAALDSARCAVDTGTGLPARVPGGRRGSRDVDVRRFHLWMRRAGHRTTSAAIPRCPGFQRRRPGPRVRTVGLGRSRSRSCTVACSRSGIGRGARCVLRYDVRTASGFSPGTSRKCSRSRSSRMRPDGRPGSAAAARPTRVRVSQGSRRVWPELSTTVSRAAEGGPPPPMMRDVTVSVQSRIDLAESSRRDFSLISTRCLACRFRVRTASDHLRAVADLIPAVRTAGCGAGRSASRRLVDRLGGHLPPSDRPRRY